MPCLISFYLHSIGGDSNDPMIVVGRQKSFTNFNFSTPHEDLIRSQASQGLPSAPSYSLMKSTNKQQMKEETSKDEGNIVETITSPYNDGISRKKTGNCYDSNNVPTSSKSDLENVRHFVDKPEFSSVKSNCKLEIENFNCRKVQNGYTKVDPIVNNNITTNQGPNTLVMSSSATLVNGNVNICKNTSSHNTSKTNSITPKAFKNVNEDTRTRMHGNNSIKKNQKEPGTENVREESIGRFSPTPTPYVDFPLQFNFGSTYASAVTVFFDDQ